MTLRQLRTLALKYAPSKGRFPPSFWKRADTDEPWLPGHELGHAFVADSSRWNKRRFGIPHRVLDCVCKDQSCRVEEAAAMMLSVRWVRACGRPDVADTEFKATAGLKLVLTSNIQRRARRRLRKLGLWPIPVTVGELRAFAEKRGLHA